MGRNVIKNNAVTGDERARYRAETTIKAQILGAISLALWRRDK
jgi:hypothetical protein